MGSDIPAALRRQVADRAYHVCEYCLVHESDTLWGCQVDHVISRKHGGATVADNLAWACACCNASKGSDIATLSGAPAQLVRLYHPRADRWAECFSLNGVVIEPAAEIGAATIRLLQFNDDNRLQERRVLAGSGRYPTFEALARMKE